MRNRMMWLWFCVAVLAVACAGTLWADRTVKVFVNGCPKIFNPPAIERNGTAYVPLRAGAQAIGAKVKWNARTGQAFITSSRRSVTVRASQGVMVKGRLLLPLRLLGDSLGCKVGWDAKASAVRINTSNPAAVPASGG